MPIALHDLRGESRGVQSQFLTNRALNLWIDMCMGPDRAAYFADANALARFCKAFFCASEFIEHEGKFRPNVIGSA